MPFALVWAASTSGKEVRQSPTIFEWPTCFAATQYSHVYRERLEGFSNEYMPYMFRKIREYELQKSQQQHTECQDTVAKGPMEDRLQ